LEYINYEKSGQYGECKTTSFAFVVGEQSEQIQCAFSDLRTGDSVKLSWRHDYVTKVDSGGGVIQSPERPVIQLEKVPAPTCD
jgi:hypothetical protein